MQQQWGWGAPVEQHGGTHLGTPHRDGAQHSNSNGGRGCTARGAAHTQEHGHGRGGAACGERGAHAAGCGGHGTHTGGDCSGSSGGTGDQAPTAHGTWERCWEWDGSGGQRTPRTQHDHSSDWKEKLGWRRCV